MGCDLKRKITLHPHFRFLQEVLPVIEMIIYQGELFGEFNKPIAGENKDKIIVSNVTRANLLVFEPYCLLSTLKRKELFQIIRFYRNLSFERVTLVIIRRNNS